MTGKVEELMKTILNSHCLDQATNLAHPDAHFKWIGTNIRKLIFSCYGPILNLLFGMTLLGVISPNCHTLVAAVGTGGTLTGLPGTGSRKIHP
jgi:cysteine synthase